MAVSPEPWAGSPALAGRSQQFLAACGFRGPVQLGTVRRLSGVWAPQKARTHLSLALCQPLNLLLLGLQNLLHVCAEGHAPGVALQRKRVSPALQTPEPARLGWTAPPHLNHGLGLTGQKVVSTKRILGFLTWV